MNKLEKIIMAQRVFDIIYLLAGIGLFVGGIFNLFGKHYFMFVLGIVFGLLIIFIAYKEIGHWEIRKQMLEKENE